VWSSITSHGRGPAQAERVGFGDVAAVAGGLVAGDDRGPCFLADAVVDPLCGLVAAAAVLEALVTGGRWLLSVALAPLAAAVAGPALIVQGAPARPPRARPAVRPAPPLGSDTADVLGGLAS
jgi:crotonobetainyl-CoA:carnitine CoA-transferase CaiB-like acyl-CoA transferase